MTNYTKRQNAWGYHIQGESRYDTIIQNTLAVNSEAFGSKYQDEKNFPLKCGGKTIIDVHQVERL